MKKGLCKSMKLRSIGRGILLGLLALNLVFVSGCGQTASAPTETKSQSVELKLAHFFPATHPAEKELIQPWAKAIETATEGRVKITSYPGQTLLQADAVYDGVVNGICFSSFLSIHLQMIY